LNFERLFFFSLSFSLESRREFKNNDDPWTTSKQRLLRLDNFVSLRTDPTQTNTLFSAFNTYDPIDFLNSSSSKGDYFSHRVAEWLSIPSIGIFTFSSNLSLDVLLHVLSVFLRVRLIVARIFIFQKALHDHDFISFRFCYLFDLEKRFIFCNFYFI